MRVKSALYFLVVGLIAAYFIYKEVTRVGGPGKIAVGQLAPDFEVKDGNGNILRLSDLRGNLVFLNFWATWCPPCVDEMPEMQILTDAFKDRKFKMVAISVDIPWEDVTRFYAEHNLSLPVYHDPGRQVASKYNVRMYPETFVIDANGYVLKYIVGPQRWASQQMLASFDDMIKDQEAQASSHEAPTRF